mmetsp:Transcript_7554/g.9878  ORF Transcript_7554/g.9878 Transcript_7554/m.9878 type:complete len:267 (+) Transcript_7554:118-918(+)
MRIPFVGFVVLSLAVAPVSAWAPSSLNRRQTRTQTQLQAEIITLDGQEIRGPITPLGNNVLVKIKDTLTATSGGILLPDQAKERPTEGLVVAAGPGKLHPFTGVRITNPIKEGVSVLYGKFDGRPVEYNNEECQMIRDDDVLLYYTGVSMKFETVVPVRDYVLIALNEKGSGDKSLQTNSGVVIAQQVMKDLNPCEGIVAKVGDGRLASKGDFSPSPVQIGDLVKFKDYAGNELTIEGKPYSLVKMISILSTTLKDDTKKEEESSE